MKGTPHCNTRNQNTLRALSVTARSPHASASYSLCLCWLVGWWVGCCFYLSSVAVFTSFSFLLLPANPLLFRFSLLTRLLDLLFPSAVTRPTCFRRRTRRRAGGHGPGLASINARPPPFLWPSPVLCPSPPPPRLPAAAPLSSLLYPLVCVCVCRPASISFLPLPFCARFLSAPFSLLASLVVVVPLTKRVSRPTRHSGAPSVRVTAWAVVARACVDVRVHVCLCVSVCLFACLCSCPSDGEAVSLPTDEVGLNTGVGEVVASSKKRKEAAVKSSAPPPHTYTRTHTLTHAVLHASR